MPTPTIAHNHRPRTNHFPFRLGWDYGAAHGPASPREAETELRAALGVPTVAEDAISAFCNGSDDGAAGDRFRLRNRR